MRLLWVLAALFLYSCATNTATGTSTNSSSKPEPVIQESIQPRSVSARLDEQDRKVMEKSSPRTVDRMDRGEPLTISDVIKLSQAGVSDSSIIDYMAQTHSTYTLSQPQVRRLQEAGVSQRVIDYMVSSPRS